MSTTETQGPSGKEAVALLEATFKDNEVLLKAMRAVMFNLQPTAGEVKLVSDTFKSTALFAAVKERFLPTMHKEADIGTVSDVWIGAESMIYGANRDTIAQAVGYKQLSHTYTEKALNLLVDPTGPTVALDVFPGVDLDPLQVVLLARNQFVRHVEKQLLYLWILGNQDKKQEVQKRLAQDSLR